MQDYCSMKDFFCMCVLWSCLLQFSSSSNDVTLCSPEIHTMKDYLVATENGYLLLEFSPIVSWIDSYCRQNEHRMQVSCLWTKWRGKMKPITVCWWNNTDCDKTSVSSISSKPKQSHLPTLFLFTVPSVHPISPDVTI